MTGTAEASFFKTISADLPTSLADQLQTLCNTSFSNELVLENLIRFVCGAECSSRTPTLDKDEREQWSDRQRRAKKTLADLVSSPEENAQKRQREDDDDSQSSKRPKTTPEASASCPAPEEVEPPIFTIHSISATSPVRKKVDITIHKSSVKFTNPTTHSVESTIALSSLRRAFILPTRGKQKPHWTVVILASDAPDRSSKASKAASTSYVPDLQIIFGLDASAPAPLTTTDFSSATKDVQTTKKGSDTLPAIRAFLARLSLPIYEPSIDVFKSACASAANSGNVGGLTGYLGAKPGNLWFFDEGILWGEAKPCEFWSVEDLLGKDGGEAVRVVSATGRMCSVVLTRKGEGKKSNENGMEVDGESDDDEEDIGEETQFGMIDAKENEGISRWVKARRHLFGREKGSAAPVPASGGKGKQKEKENGSDEKKAGDEMPRTILQLADDSDDSDENFEVSSDDDGGSASSSSSSDDEGDANSGDEEEEEAEAEGSDDEVEELDPKHHPLLRPGAMPKMSRAAMDMAVGMVEEDMMGSNGDGDDEEDELDD